MDYQAMYVKLFQSQTKAIRILQEAQVETEEMYIGAEPPDIRLLHTPKDGDGSGKETSDGGDNGKE